MNKTGNRLVDLAGKKFNRWTVIERNGIATHGAAAWLCRCDCGVQRTVSGGSLRKGLSKSCGCLNVEQLQSRATHGMTETRTYHIWCGMRKRCLNPKATTYKRYGGRGIKISERWSKFENFLADMGECPAGMSIERKENSGNYEPGNCIWADVKTQANNRRNAIRVTIEGEQITLDEACKRFGISYSAAYRRAHDGRGFTGLPATHQPGE